MELLAKIFTLAYGALTSCKKLEKNNEQSPRYLKTDGWTDGLTRAINGRTNKGDYPGPHRVDAGSKIIVPVEGEDMHA